MDTITGMVGADTLTGGIGDAVIDVSYGTANNPRKACYDSNPVGLA